MPPGTLRGWHPGWSRGKDLSGTAGPVTRRSGDGGADRTPGQGEPAMGVPAGTRRTGAAGTGSGPRRCNGFCAGNGSGPRRVDVIHDNSHGPAAGRFVDRRRRRVHRGSLVSARAAVKCWPGGTTGTPPSMCWPRGRPLGSPHGPAGGSRRGSCQGSRTSQAVAAGGAAEDVVAAVDSLQQADADHVGERRGSAVGDEG